MRKSAGIGLLELMLGLAIIALLVIMATRYYQSAKESRTVTDAVQQITIMSSAALEFRGGRGSYAGVNTSTLVGSDYLGSHFSGSTTTDFVNAWGETGGEFNSVSPFSNFYIIYHTPSAGTCLRLKEIIESKNTEYSTGACTGTHTFKITYVGT